MTPAEHADMDAEERADAEHRVAHLTATERKFVLRLAENDHKLEIEGERAYVKTWKDLEDKGWTRASTNGWTGSDCLTTVQFTLDGWNALCILLDQIEAKEKADGTQA